MNDFGIICIDERSKLGAVDNTPGIGYARRKLYEIREWSCLKSNGEKLREFLGTERALGHWRHMQQAVSKPSSPLGSASRCDSYVSSRVFG